MAYCFISSGISLSWMTISPIEIVGREKLVVIEGKAKNPPASSCSALIIAFTPLYMSWTKSTSDLPRRRLFEISKIPSSVSVCSPWIPLI